MMHKAVCTLIVFMLFSSVASVDSSINTCITDNTKRSQPLDDQTSLIQKHLVVKMSTEETAKEKPRAKPHNYQVGMQVEVRRSDNSWSPGTISAVTPDEVEVDIGGGSTRKVPVGDLDNLEMIKPLASRLAESTPAKVSMPPNPHNYHVGMHVLVQRNHDVEGKPFPSGPQWSPGTISSMTPEEVVITCSDGITKHLEPQLGDLQDLTLMKPAFVPNETQSRPAEATGASEHGEDMSSALDRDLGRVASMNDEPFQIKLRTESGPHVITVHPGDYIFHEVAMAMRMNPSKAAKQLTITFDTHHIDPRDTFEDYGIQGGSSLSVHEFLHDHVYEAQPGFPQGVEELFKGRAMDGNYGEHMGSDGAFRQVGFILVPFGGGVRNTGLIIRDYEGLTTERGFGDVMQYIYTDGLAGCLCLCLTGEHFDTGHMDVFFAHSPAWQSATADIWNQAKLFAASHSQVKIFWGTGTTQTMGYEETAGHIYGVLSDSIPGIQFADLQGDNSRWGMPNLAFDFVHDELVPITEGGRSPVTITIDNSGAEPVFLVPNPKVSKASAERALHKQTCSLGSCSGMFCSGLRKNQKTIINTLQTCTEEGGDCCGSSGGMMKALRCINHTGGTPPMVFNGMPASLTGAMSRADFDKAIAQTGTKEAADKFYDWLSYECPVPQDVAVPGLTRLPNVEGETQKYGT